MSKQGRYSFQFFLLLIFFLDVLFVLASNQRKFYSHPTENVSFRSALEDNTNDIFLLDQWNQIYQFDRNLNPSQTQIPRFPSTDPNETVGDGEQVFLLQKNPKSILACSGGSCGILTFGDENKWSILDQRIEANVFSRNGSRTLSVAYEATHTNNTPIGTWFYVASAVQFNSTHPVLSIRRKIPQQTRPDPGNFEFTPNEKDPKIPGVFKVRESLRSSYRVEPIFLGILPTKNSENQHAYGYLLTWQSVNGRPVTRIGRFCAGDPTLRSYMEVTISCNLVRNFGGRRRTEFYTVATGAALRQDNATGEYFMVISFGRSGGVHWGPVCHQRDRFTLCIYSLSEIDQRFDKVIHNCYWNGKGRMLNWISDDHYDSRECKSHQELVNESMAKNNPLQALYCREARKAFLHGLLDGTGEEIRGNAVDLSNSTMEGLHLVKLPPGSSLNASKFLNTLAIMFMADGKLQIKEQINETTLGQLFWTNDSALIPVANFSCDMENNHAILHADDSRYLMFNGSKLESFPVGCGIHGDCDGCMTQSNKLLGCGWCDVEDICSTRVDCEEEDGKYWSSNTCPPKITDFYPKNGTMMGNTILTILGKYFGGNATESVKVTIGNSDCIVFKRNFTWIQCRTTRQSKISILLNVRVQIKSPDVCNTTLGKPYKCQGRSKEYKGERFNFQLSEVTRFTPDFGPTWGGTVMTLEGKNLAAGGERQVRLIDPLHDFDCRILSVNNTHIICITPILTSDLVGSIGLSVSLLIDNQTTKNIHKKFQYRTSPSPDPIQPDSRPIFSGGTWINFTGNNFDLLQDPRLLIDVVGWNITKTTTCEIVNKRLMRCIAPAIQNIELIDYPIKVNRTLLLQPECCHNSTGSFYYYPDPVISKITVALVEPPNYWNIIIQGWNLGNFDLNVLNVSIGGRSYNNVFERITKASKQSRRDLSLLPEDIIYVNISYANELAGRNTSLQFHYGNLNVPRFYREFPASKIPTVATTSSLSTQYQTQHQKQQDTTSSNSQTEAAHALRSIIGLAVGLLIIILLTFLAFRYRHKRCMKRIIHFVDAASPSLSRVPSYFEGELIHRSPAGGNIYECHDLTNCLRQLEIRRDSLNIEHTIILGKGEYSIVHKGLASNLPTISHKKPIAVAVKSLIGGQQEILEEEARIILKIGRHINIVNVLGIVRQDPALLILEYCAFGSLLSYLQRRQRGRVYIHVNKNGDLLPFDKSKMEYQWFKLCLQEGKQTNGQGRITDNMLSTNDLLKFSYQICNGMEYLSARSIIHRDLAARNVLVANNNILKISDFGLAKQGTLMYTAVNAMTVLPIMWLPPEAIIDRIFSIKSDVWSFGIVLWEIFSLGQSPFNQPDVVKESAIAFAEWLTESHQMKRPEGAPSSIYDIMKSCWNLETGNRPDFTDIRHLLDAIVSNTEDDQLMYLALKDGKSNIDEIVKKTFERGETHV